MILGQGWTAGELRLTPSAGQHALLSSLSYCGLHQCLVHCDSGFVAFWLTSLFKILW